MIGVVPVGALATAALIEAERLGHLPSRVVTKTLASTCFVVQAWLAGAPTAGAIGGWLLLALGLSMAGDLFLLSRDKRAFLAGLVAFLLGHVAYVGLFVALGVALPGAVLAGTGLGFVGLAVYRWLAPKAGRLARPVAAYVVVISCMVTAAAGAAWAQPDPVRLGLLGAALAFWASDLCVARDRFVAPGWTNRLVGLPLYYGAQLAFATLAPLAAG